MSGNLIELLHNAIETSTGDTVQFKKVLQSCLEQGSFYSQDKAEAVIRIINKCLNSSFDKEKGLILLLNLLSQISVEAFSNNAISWMVSCNKIFSQKEGTNNVLALKVFRRLIQLSVKFPEVYKEASKQIVPRFFLDHVRRKSTPQISVELLECIQSCMSQYPGPLGEFRLDIVKLLLSTVEGHSETVVAASRCVPLLAGLGGGGKQGVSHKTAWQRQQMVLVGLLHTLLNRLYEHIDCQAEEVTAAIEDGQFPLELINERNILTKSQRLATQFTSIALFLQAMLLEQFSVAKSVAPDAILGVVVHAQKSTLTTLGSSREALAVTAVLPTIQVSAVRLLESLVLCLGRNLVPQGGLVCHLCSQILHWTHQQHIDWPYAMNKPYSETRHAVYCCLHSWLTVAGAASQLETVMDKLLPPMLADIHTEKPSVRLRVGSKAGKGRKKQQVLVNQEDRSERLGDPAANNRLCERALLTLQLLLRTTVARLKPDMVSRITNTVLQLTADLPVPYSDANCLTALYQLFLTLCLELHPRLAPPLPPALAVFTSGTHHPIPVVRETCLAALSSLDKIIYPTAPALYFPLTQKKHQPEKTMKEKENDDDENSMPVLKRMRYESLNNTSPCHSIEVEIEEQSSGKPSDEEQIEVIDCDSTSDPKEIIEPVPVESQMQNIKTKVFVKKMKLVEESEDEEIDVVEITDEDENVNSNSQKTGEREPIANSQSVPSCGKDEEKEEGFNQMEESNKSKSPSLSKTENKSESLTHKQVIEIDKDLTSEEDADVSQMLMDFTDEVNDGTEN